MSFISVIYDYDSDRITIRPVCFDCELEATEQVCGKLIGKIRDKALVRAGKAYLTGTFRFASYFAQAGYSLTNAPKDMLQQIDKMFVVSVQITQFAAGDKPEKVIFCEAPLLGTGYSVKRP